MSDPRLIEMDFPEGERFKFLDDLGPHDPCYIVMPGGAALPVNHHAGAGVDIARAKFIVRACNHLLDGYLKRPQGVESAPYIVGRWMVTGPDCEDGSGWSLCAHKDGKCQRCVASFDRQEDAEHAARLRHLAEEQPSAAAAQPPVGCESGNMINQNIPRGMNVGWRADHTLSPGTIEVWQNGTRIGRIENIGKVPPGQDQ